mgnify:CR=1 FL=1
MHVTPRRLVLTAILALSLAASSSCALFDGLRVADPSFARAEKAALLSIYTSQSIGGLNAGLIATAQGLTNSWGQDLLPGLTAELRARLTSEVGLTLVDDAAVAAHATYQGIKSNDPFAGTPKESVSPPPLRPVFLTQDDVRQQAAEVVAAVGADIGISVSLSWLASRDSGDYTVQTTFTLRAVDQTGKLVWEQVEVVTTTQALKLSDLASLGADIGAAMVGSMREEPTKNTAMAGAREAMTTIFTSMKEAR